MRLALCLFISCLAACSSSATQKPHTEVTSDLMWMVSDGTTVSVSCRDKDNNVEQVQITRDAFLRDSKGITITLLDLIVSAVGLFYDFGDVVE